MQVRGTRGAISFPKLGRAVARCAVRATLLAAVAASLGCASLRNRRADAQDLATADLRVLQGCYDCLLDARTVYARIADARDRKNAALAIVRLFETELLLVLREKELALDWRPSVERARALVARVPAAVEPRRVLDAVDAVMPDINGIPTRTAAAMRQARRPYAGKVAGELAWLAQSPLQPAVREYLWRALECEFPQRSGGVREPLDSIRRRRQPGPGAPPLIVYQAARCMGGDSLLLRQVTAAVPAFVEGAYVQGRAAIAAADETGGDDARALLERAYARFSNSPSVTFLLGWLGTVTEQCAGAVRYYGETIALEPEHEAAHLQRLICLSSLRQDSAAIAAATTLIALEPTSVGQAYYYRALSRLRRRELELARSDIEEAKRRESAVNILSLAGVIAYNQDDLSSAERDMRAARELPMGEKACTAAWYLGLIQNRGSRWREAGASFVTAMTCYDDRIGEARAMIPLIERHPRMKPAVKARRIAALEAEITEQQTQYFAGAFNAANNSAKAGDLARARELVDVASRDPSLAEQVGKLRALLAAMERIPPY